MKRQKNNNKVRFAACAAETRLLSFLSEAAARATAGGRFWEFHFLPGGLCRDDFAWPMSKNILTRSEILRGRISRRKININTNRSSKKGRICAKSHE